MGHVRASVRVAHLNRRDDPVEIKDALVDTGATFTAVPRPLAQRPDLEILGQHHVRTAVGVKAVDRSFAYMELEGRDAVLPVWISDEYPGVLIGVYTLDALALAVDPKSGCLIDAELLLL